MADAATLPPLSPPNSPPLKSASAFASRGGEADQPPRAKRSPSAVPLGRERPPSLFVDPSPRPAGRSGSGWSEGAFEGDPAAKRFSFAASTVPPTPRGETAEEEDEPAEDAISLRPQGHASVALAVAIVPPILATLVPTKSSELWGDLFAVLLVAYYLHFIISVPYELYHKSRQRSYQSRVLEAAIATSPNHPVSAAQRAADAELNRLQLMYLLLYLASPALAGVALKVAKDNLFSATGPIAKQLNTGVFIFVAAIRPLGELSQLLRERTLLLRKEAAVPVTEVDALLHRVGELERALEAMGREVATREDVQQVKEQHVDPSLDRVARAVRKVERRESTRADADEQRFRALERRLGESEERVKKMAVRLDAFGLGDPATGGGLWGFVYGYVAAVLDILLLPVRVASSVVRVLSGAMSGQIAGAAAKPMIKGGEHLS